MYGGIGINIPMLLGVGISQARFIILVTSFWLLSTPLSALKLACTVENIIFI